MSLRLLIPIIALITAIACDTPGQATTPIAASTPTPEPPAIITTPTATVPVQPTKTSPPALVPTQEPTLEMFTPTATATRPPRPTAPEATVPKPAPIVATRQFSLASIADINPNLPRLWPSHQRCLQEHDIDSLAIQDNLNVRIPEAPPPARPNLIAEVKACIDAAEPLTGPKRFALVIATAAAATHPQGSPHLTLFHWEPYNWFSGNMGCNPSYTPTGFQEPVSGYVALFATDDNRTVQVHVDQSNYAFVPAHCDHVGPDYRQDGHAIQRAYEHAVISAAADPNLDLIHWQTYAWGNGAMGCNEHSVIAPAVVVDGYIVIFADPDGNPIRIHAANHGRIFNTRECQAVSPSLDTHELARERQALKNARTIAGAHLRTSEDLTLLHWQDYTWGNGGMGCTHRGGAYTDAMVDGFVGVFATPDNQQVQVHVAGSRSIVTDYCERVSPQINLGTG